MQFTLFGAVVVFLLTTDRLIAEPPAVDKGPAQKAKVVVLEDVVYGRQKSGGNGWWHN